MSNRLDEALKFKQGAEELFTNYIEHRRRGELWKAGEYLWGAFQALLLALAGALGREVPTRHRALRLFASELADITGEASIREAFKDGERLHANFYYPGLLDEEEVVKAILAVERCVDRLSELLEREIRRLSERGT